MSRPRNRNSRRHDFELTLDVAVVSLGGKSHRVMDSYKFAQIEE